MKSKQQKKAEGEARNAQWAALSREMKLRRLDVRLGVGQGAKRQRRKLASE